MEQKDNQSLTPEAMAPCASSGTLSELLKEPDRFAFGVCKGDGIALSVRTVLAGIAGYALFGLAAGFFAGPVVALLDAAKGAGIALFSFVLCLPGLYVFTCISGTSLAMPQIVAAGGACLAMTGFMLAALAPVLWLFAVSSGSVAFVTVLTFALAFLSAFFALRPTRALASVGAVRSLVGLRVWFVVLVFVSLQMVTLLRPMLAAKKPDAKPVGKCFFLSHFADVVFADD